MIGVRARVVVTGFNIRLRDRSRVRVRVRFECSWLG